MKVHAWYETWKVKRTTAAQVTWFCWKTSFEVNFLVRAIQRFHHFKLSMLFATWHDPRSTNTIGHCPPQLEAWGHSANLFLARPGRSCTGAQAQLWWMWLQHRLPRSSRTHWNWQHLCLQVNARNSGIDSQTQMLSPSCWYTTRPGHPLYLCSALRSGPVRFFFLFGEKPGPGLVCRLLLGLIDWNRTPSNRLPSVWHGHWTGCARSTW
jgi:hypothetical protein